MKILSLKDPYPNGFEREDDPVALAYLEELKEVRAALLDGKLYGKFVDGDRKGSICKLTTERIPDEPYISQTSSFYKNKKYRIQNCYFFNLTCTWDGRRNRVKIYLPSWELVALLDYDGPTVWEKFDSASAKEKVLENPNQKDIDGNILNIGDRVFFINARYGSGFCLERGTIKEFKVTADSKKTSVTTVIENDNGLLSNLKYPHEMVCKISGPLK